MSMTLSTDMNHHHPKPHFNGLPLGKTALCRTMSPDVWKHRLVEATCTAFDQRIRYGQPLVVSKGRQSVLSAFMYSGKLAGVWEEMSKASREATSRPTGEAAHIKNDMKDFTQTGLIRPGTMLEFGSGGVSALQHKTGVALKLFNIERYVTFEMSPDFVRLPATILGGSSSFPYLQSVTAIQADHTLGLHENFLSDIRGIDKQDMMLFSVGSGFCNLHVIPENGFPEKEYQDLFRQYAKLGELNPGHRVSFYISYYEGTKRQYEENYADESTARWFLGVPYFLDRELKPGRKNGTPPFAPNAYAYKLVNDMSRYFTGGSLVATEDQGGKIQNGMSRDLDISQGESLMVNMHWAPPLDFLCALAEPAGWNVKKKNKNGPYNRVLFELDRAAL